MSELSELLHCFGYFGFGSGYGVAMWGQSDDTHEMACDRCDRKHACWARHKERTRTLLPTLCAVSDQVLAEGFLAETYLEEFQRRTGFHTQKCTEPFVAVMSANIADGASVAMTGHTVQRLKDRLVWPLQALE